MFGSGMHPVHPGEVLLEDYIKPMGMSVYAVAKAIKVPWSRLQEITMGQRRVTVDTALRLERYFGSDARVWLNLQAEYDLRIAQSEIKKDIAKEIKPITKKNLSPSGDGSNSLISERSIKKVSGLTGNHISALEKAANNVSVIRELHSKGRLTSDDIKIACKVTGKSRQTIYRWLRKFKEGNQTITAFLPKKRSDKGLSRLPNEANEIIKSTLNMSAQAVREKTLTLRAIHKIIADECKKFEIHPPSITTVRNFYLAMPETKDFLREKSKSSSAAWLIPVMLP